MEQMCSCIKKHPFSGFFNIHSEQTNLCDHQQLIHIAPYTHIHESMRNSIFLLLKHKRLPGPMVKRSLGIPGKGLDHRPHRPAPGQYLLTAGMKTTTKGKCLWVNYYGLHGLLPSCKTSLRSPTRMKSTD